MQIILSINNIGVTMSVAVYKDGEKTFIEPEFLQNHLDAGYSLTKDEPVKEKSKAKPRAKKSQPKE